ncbi:MAG TPA: ABC transporter permease [Candidatus Kapabacteria bacterium]|jgi:phospholipid/cholesterol/gamma-HCH transport system permease protein
MTSEASSQQQAVSKAADTSSSKKRSGGLALLGGLWLFSVRFVRTLARPPYEFKEIVRQIYASGFRSISLVTVVGVVIGAVLTMQSRPTMIEFGAEAFIPAMVAIGVMRELSPVIISIILAGRIAAGIGAELGSMRASEQIDAMDVAALDPFKLLVFTRVVACMIVLPALTIYADFLALGGSWVVEKIEAGMTVNHFITSVVRSIAFSDYLPGVAKTIFFGFIIGIVGCYEGYNSTGGTEGVGKSATDAVVTSSLLIIVLDVVFVKITLMLWPS